MMKSMNQKAEGSKAAGSAKCGAQSSNNKKAAPVCVFENPEFGMVRTATDERASLGSVLKICVMYSDTRERI